MSKMTQRKSMEYIKKEYPRTRTMPASWYLNAYRFKYNVTHMKPFLDKLKEGKLVGLQCSNCNRVSFPPKIVCGNCLIKPDRWVDLRETATVATYTVTYLKDEVTGKIVEKPIVCIRQDGSDTTHITELAPEVNYDDVYVGMPIKIHWADNLEGNLSDIAYYDVIEDKAKDMKLRAIK
ncbi:MAG: Zn-ribbon domain-containing OB-fold protein [Promethearchaeota archaeon]